VLFYHEGRGSKFLLNGRSCLPDYIPSHLHIHCRYNLKLHTILRLFNNIVSTSEGGREEGMKMSMNSKDFETKQNTCPISKHCHGFRMNGLRHEKSCRGLLVNWPRL
jgi:hypothetical protein